MQCQLTEATLIAGIASRLKAPPIRTIAQFAEQEIVIPDGPYEGRRFRLSRSPAARLMFEEMARGCWERIFVTGPNQDGKTLAGLVIPVLYLLFERRETVILGVPTEEIAADKWKIDFLPTIKRSGFKDQLPTSGAGSREGEATLIEFKNGARLRFMTGGGGDQTRSAFTSKNLAVTETDGFDVVGGSSREGDKFSQLERRLLAFGDQARVVAECTVSTETGRTWQEYQQGTRSRIVLPCPHCGEWVTPEREHLKGWQEATTEIEAAENARLHCPACDEPWTNEQRIDVNQQARLVHRDQSIDSDGNVVGPAPQTKTLGFRWSVVNSILNPERLSRVGRDEWRAKRAVDEEIAEKDLCQKEWALPGKSATQDVSKLDAAVISGRTLSLDRGVCPKGTLRVTIGVDVGQYRCHWTAIAWTAGATPHVVAYGVIEVDAGERGADAAIMAALSEWRDQVARVGFDDGEGKRTPAFVFVDSGKWSPTIYAFCQRSGHTFYPTKGYGVGQRSDVNVRQREHGTTVVATGERYGLVQLPGGQQLIEIDANHWKGFVHDRVKTPLEDAGALTLHAGQDHFSFAKHLTAERREETFSPQHGRVTRWRAVRENNHWLDATALACVAAHMAGSKLATTTPTPPPEAPKPVPKPKSASWLPDTSNWLSR